MSALFRPDVFTDLQNVLCDFFGDVYVLWVDAVRDGIFSLFPEFPSKVFEFLFL